MAIGTYILIITLNVNGLNAPTKRHRLTEWIQKQGPYICCLQETHFRPRDTYRLKVRAWKKIFHANGNQKKAGVAILISDKIDLKIKKQFAFWDKFFLVLYFNLFSSFSSDVKYIQHLIPKANVSMTLLSSPGFYTHMTNVIGP